MSNIIADRIPISRAYYILLMHKSINRFDDFIFDFNPAFEFKAGETYLFSNCEFRTRLDLTERKLEIKDIFFEGCNFNGLTLKNQTIDFKLHINFCEFNQTKKDGDFELINLDIKSEIQLFELKCEEFILLDCDFSKNSKLLIFNTTTKEEYPINLNSLNCNFKSEVDIQLANDSNHKSNITFNNCNFHEIMQVTAKSLENLTLYACVFYKNFRLSTTYSEIAYQVKYLKISNSDFQSFAAIQYVNILKLELENLQNKIPFFFHRNKVKKSYTETFKYLKHQHLRKNDYTGALEFHKREMHKTLDDNLRKKDFSNVLILTLNYLSNNYGTSWLKGILFTISVALLFFGLYISAISPKIEVGFDISGYQYIWNHHRNEFWKFLNPTHKPFSITKLKPNFIAGLIDFLGRIFILYGSYQTVQAFRKFGRK